jgi:hypothetical protein
MGGKKPNLVTEIFPPSKSGAEDNSANRCRNKNLSAQGLRTTNIPSGLIFSALIAYKARGALRPLRQMRKGAP